MIPYSKQYIDNDDIKAVVNVLKSPFLTQGPEVENFEKTIAEFVGVKYALAVSSATAGLHIAYQAIGLSKNDLFVTSPISFVSTANAGLYCGATPIFCDINLQDGNISPNELEAIAKNKNIKLIAPVHYAGYPCDMKKIKSIASKNKNFKTFIIEDAAHALGGEYKNGKKIGSCCYSDMTVFSFHPVKNITTGEGGVITTNNKTFYKKLLRLRSHGINKLDDKFIFRKNGKNPWYYEMREIGYHYRMTCIQAALGISQLNKINIFKKKKQNLQKKYHKLFYDVENISMLKYENLNLSGYHLFVLLINFDKLKVTRADLMNYLRKNGIITQVHYIPIHNHPYYKKNLNISAKTPVADTFYNQCISIPFFYKLKLKDQIYISNLIKEFIS